jgi:hypothetical protein
VARYRESLNATALLCCSFKVYALAGFEPRPSVAKVAAMTTAPRRLGYNIKALILLWRRGAVWSSSPNLIQKIAGSNPQNDAKRSEFGFLFNACIMDNYPSPVSAFHRENWTYIWVVRSNPTRVQGGRLKNKKKLKLVKILWIIIASKGFLVYMLCTHIGTYIDAVAVCTFR